MDIFKRTWLSNSKLLWNKYEIHDQQNRQNWTILTKKIADSSCFDHHCFRDMYTSSELISSIDLGKIVKKEGS